MPGDHSRFTFDPRRRFTGVRMQQGRVQLDADWNEEHDLLAERARLLALDAGGPAWLPAETTPDAFKVGLVAGPPADLSLGEGRLWLDGRLAEIFAGEGVSYRSQPFLPDPPAFDPTAHTIVYLDLWERDVTWAHDPRLLDVALGGIDTTTRVQQVWQVRLHRIDAGGNAAPAACGVDLDALFPPSAGRLTTRATAPPAPDDPCVLPPVAGYRGIENRLYRIEIQVPGPLGTAKFKWSRDNGSIMARVSALAVAGGQTRITVNRIGRDEVLRFRVGDWVTLTDDTRELMGEAGQMARVADIDEAARIVVLDRVVPAAGGRAFAGTAADHAARATRLQRWDQSAPVNAIDGDGLMVTGPGPIVLEDGVEALFSTAPAGGGFRIGNHWLFAARTADASVEVLTAAPPRGRRHRRLQLAAIPAGGPVQDCRPKPTADGCCTFVVAPGGDIQAAIDKLPPAGGCVCLKAGVHAIDRPLTIVRDNVHLHGESLGAVIVDRRGGGALVVRSAAGTRVETIDFRQPEAATGPMIVVAGAQDTAVRDCRLTGPGRQGNTGIIVWASEELLLAELGFANAVIGVLMQRDARDVRIDGCRFAMAAPGDDVPNTVAIAALFGRDALDIRGCTIEGALNGIIVNDSPARPNSWFTGPAIRDNRITLVADPADAECHGIDVAARGAQVTGNIIRHAGGNVTGIRLAGSGARARRNHVVSTAQTPGTAAAIRAGLMQDQGGEIADIVVGDNIVEGAQHGIGLLRVRRGAVTGNSIGGGLPGSIGVVLFDCDDGHVAANSCTGCEQAFGIANGSRNRLVGNRAEGGSFAVTVASEEAPTVADTTVTGAAAAGIIAVATSGRTVMTGNRISRCGSASAVGASLAAMGVLGEWVVGGNTIADTGVPVGPAAPGAPRAIGILGLAVVAASITANEVIYSSGDLRVAAEDRALLMQGYFEMSFGEVVVGTRAHIHGNSFAGPGIGALVEITQQPINDTSFRRFERVLYTDNHHWHFNGGIGVGGNMAGTARRPATVRLTGRALSVSGNHVNSIAKGFPSWDLGGRPGPFIGNVSDGPVIDRAAPASQFPAPATAFNLF